ncbi:helix-turn-helix domain-containing protein [Methylobacterium sp. J-048]|uniref:helix-turn-helix domain-containing protein n=1 Tax=Methylobacterium sp. J-048 TaxID=2836635 RepID=UPI001FBA00A7|nr:helix-turn-helix domain-containing protein [Methylobacterium sp. J-048]MCJ2056179.1 helix-turn-helix domain-containing protein [Methylobacterium sp. J-048]
MSPDTATRVKPGRKPSIARHPACVEIEFACARGISLRRVAEQFGVSRASINRHWHALPADHRARLVGLATELDRYEARIREVYAALAVMAPPIHRLRNIGAVEHAHAA